MGYWRGPASGRPDSCSAGENTRETGVGDKTLKPSARFVGATRAQTALDTHRDGSYFRDNSAIPSSQPL